MSQERIERDSLGEVPVPVDALYGAQTARARSTFRVSGERVPGELIEALCRIKAEAARENGTRGLLSEERAAAIVAAAAEVAEGGHREHFVVDVYQTGSGTSTNMNVNEVLAHLAQARLREAAPDLEVHPNDHVNLGQSSNDVFPSAIHLALLVGTRDRLLPALRPLADALHDLADQHFGELKTGRTHLMDAVPLRRGQELRGHADQIDRGIARIEEATAGLHELALGGTAVGTGINTPDDFGAAVCGRLGAVLGLPLRCSSSPFQAQSAVDAVVHFSGSLRTLTTALYKITNDLRWMASGPGAGLAELEFPATQPGSSIMPGKVNPVVCESVLMVCLQVLGLDGVVALANSQGQFQLNTMLPLVGRNTLECVRLLAAATIMLREKGLEGLRFTGGAQERLERSPMLATALAPRIGYAAAAEIAKEAARSGRPVREIARERGGLDDAELAVLLDPERLCGRRGEHRPRREDPGPEPPAPGPRGPDGG